MIFGWLDDKISAREIVAIGQLILRYDAMIFAEALLSIPRIISNEEYDNY